MDLGLYPETETGSSLLGLLPALALWLCSPRCTTPGQGRQARDRTWGNGLSSPSCASSRTHQPRMVSSRLELVAVGTTSEVSFSCQFT